MNRTFCFVLSAILTSGLAMADDEPGAEEQPDQQRNQRLQKIYQQQAEEYIITIGEDEPMLELSPKPVFNWLNTARVGQPQVHKGAVYVWTQQGRAEVVGTIFSVTNKSPPPNFYHEFHSLAAVPLKASAGGSLRWNTPEAGVKFTKFVETAAPAETSVRRLAEMRTLARRFSGYSINYDGVRWGLNLLPQPLYRMPKPEGEVLDQAVFALISTAGTDPEVLLDIEARKVDEVFQWQYCICRFTDLKSFVSLDDKAVWSFENGSTGAYTDAGMKNRYRLLNAGTIDIDE